MTIQEVLNKTILFFKEKNFPTARLDAELLISKSLGLSRIDLYLKFDSPINEPELNKCRDFVKRRSNGEPVAYILGEKDFFGSSFVVNRNTLIPRPETETLVETVIKFINQNDQIKSAEKINVLDLGTGTGCIGISIAKKVPNSFVELVDLSEESLAITKINAERHGVLAQTKIVHSDVEVLNLQENEYHVIMSNPPYIAPSDISVEKNVKKFEPHLALFAEDNGFGKIKSWSSKAIGALKSPGMMIFECGTGQGEQVKQQFQDFKIFSQVDIIEDLAGHDRFVVGYK